MADELERRLRFVERLEKPVSFVIAAALAGVYVWWRYTAHHVIATYTWMIPFAIGYAIPFFGFSWWGARLEAARRADVELPAARVVATEKPREPVPPVSTAPPPAVAPADPAEGPQFLK